MWWGGGGSGQDSVEEVFILCSGMFCFLSHFLRNWSQWKTCVTTSHVYEFSVPRLDATPKSSGNCCVTSNLRVRFTLTTYNKPRSLRSSHHYWLHIPESQLLPILCFSYTFIMRFCSGDLLHYPDQYWG